MEKTLSKNIWQISNDIFYIKDKHVVVRCKKEMFSDLSIEELPENGKDAENKCIFIYEGIRYPDVVKLVENSEKNACFTVVANSPGKAKNELIDLLKGYFHENGIANAHFICGLSERDVIVGEAPYDEYIYLDGLSSFRNNFQLLLKNAKKSEKRFYILQPVNAENFDSLYIDASYFLKKYDEHYIPLIHFAVTNDINSPTIPYMSYSRVINSLRSKYRNRISCCEYKFKNVNCNVYRGKAFEECQQCFAYGFCPGNCEHHDFRGIEYDNPIQQRICCARKNIIGAYLRLLVVHDGKKLDMNGDSITYSYIDSTNNYMGEISCWLQKMR